MPTFRPLAAAAMAAAALSLAPAAFADTAQVRHADLDLATAAGRAELNRRIDKAAQRVCAEAPRTGSRIVNRAEMRECIAYVRGQVQARLNGSGPADRFGR